MFALSTSNKNWDDSHRIGIDQIDRQRKTVIDFLDNWALDPRTSIEDKQFMDDFVALEDAIATLFASEEYEYASLGVPDDEKRRHVHNHDRLLESFNHVYLGVFQGHETAAAEVTKAIKLSLTEHILGYDIRLQQYVNSRQEQL